MQFRTKRKGTKFTIYGFDDRKGVGRVRFTICVYSQEMALIEDLFVLEQYRKQGFGRQLVEEAIRQAFQFSVIRRVMLVDASEHRQTSRIAKQLGFNEQIGDCTGLPVWIKENKNEKVIDVGSSVAYSSSR